MELKNILSIGTVTNVTAKNISYSNIYGFTTGNLQSVQIQIIDISSYRLFGTFEVAFVNANNLADVIKAKGQFNFLGLNSAIDYKCF